MYTELTLNVCPWFTDDSAKWKADGVHWVAAALQLQGQLWKTDCGKDCWIG